jgi:hypothetical protein
MTAKRMARPQRVRGERTNRSGQVQVRRRASSTGSIAQRACKLLDAAALLAHNLATVAGRTQRASDVRNVTDAAQVAHLLWRVAEAYADGEVAA